MFPMLPERISDGNDKLFTSFGFGACQQSDTLPVYVEANNGWALRTCFSFRSAVYQDLMFRVPLSCNWQTITSQLTFLGNHNRVGAFDKQAVQPKKHII